MPLLLCPNDNAAMQTVERDGVQFDMCPTCRGVWLDRGELEKLMAAAAQTAAPPQAAPYPAPLPPRQDYAPPQQDYRGRDDYRHRDDDRKRGYYKKPKSIFDIFD